MKSSSNTFVIALVFLFAVSVFEIHALNRSVLKEQSAQDSIYEKVDKVPVFKKNGGNIQKYLSKHIKYPVDAFAKEIEGKVLVSFVVTKDGEIGNVKLEKGLYPSIDKEALNVVETLQSWKPGVVNGNTVNTYVKIPVHFYISEENRKIANQIKPFYANDRAPLFVLDKKKVVGLTTLEDYNIKSIRVMKGAKAIALYGEEAKNGVLIIETKRGTDPVYKRY